MEEISYLKQFKEELSKLAFEDVSQRSKITVHNTSTYYSIIYNLVEKVFDEAILKNQEAQYLIEIREQWQLHIMWLDIVRNTYEKLNFNKLPKPKFFVDKGKPAYLELKGSVLPEENKFISYDERQNNYWQYLLFARLLEGAMISIEMRLCEELGVKANFEQVNDSNRSDTICKLGDEFMIDLVFKEDSVILNEIKEVEATIRSALKSIYTNVNQENYEWFIKSLLEYSFPGKIKIPKIDLDNTTFSLMHSCPNGQLYNKIRYIKNKIYPNKTGRKKFLTNILLTCTKNLEGKKCLKEEIIMNKI